MPVLKVQPGQVLDDRFRIDRELGRGGMSILYLADDLETRQRVVVKVPLPKAVALLMLSWPLVIVVPPLYVLLPERVNVPLPSLVKE